MLCCLTQFSHIRPRHEIDQEVILDWLAKIHARAAEKEEGIDFAHTYKQISDKLSTLGVGKERIATRGAQISDLFQEIGEIYPVGSHPKGKGFAERSTFFDREVSAIMTQFYPETVSLPPHLIHVTCTGYVAPSPAQKLVSLREMGKKTTVTHAYHMGCYAALPAIRMAAGFLALPSPHHQADIVHTEVCSLHMHPTRHSTEQLIVQSLFADGFIKYTALPECTLPHFKVLVLHEETIPNSLHCMTWRCEDHGLTMTLSKEVPVLIARSLEGYLDRLCDMAQLDKEKVKKEALFAVHPGGPKILQNVEKILELRPEQMAHSKEVLRSFGNMSSATLPHIWEKILNEDSIADGTLVVSMAFGPGLSISGALFQKKVC